MTKSFYPCLSDKHAAEQAPPAEYFAKNNVPKLGHVCKGCFSDVPEHEKEHYGHLTATDFPAL